MFQRSPMWSSGNFPVLEQAGEQRDEGGADEDHTATGHELLDSLAVHGVFSSHRG